MGRKKKKPVKPWCWYCNREFDDDKILVQHQRAKHFKCPFCHKKLYSGPGLTVHCIQVHKEALDKIPEALPNRNSVDIDIYGMQGIPDEDIREHERLKRGDDGFSKQRDSNQNNQQQQQQQNKSKSQPHQSTSLQHPAMTAMHAAMFQHAMGMGTMPPGFPMPPGMPPIMPPGMPPGMPPNFMGPPGFRPMTMPPGMSLPMRLPPGMIPGMLPPPTSLSNSHMGFPLRPPPMGPVPSTSGLPIPPPMSGVGHLIGVPPPQYPLMTGGNTANKTVQASSNQHKGFPEASNQSDNKASHQSSYRSQAAPTTNTKEPEASKSSSSSATTISKPASTASKSSSFEFDNFIQIPGTESRIMHPNNDLTLEELRLRLKKYRVLIDKLPPNPPETDGDSQSVGCH